MTTRIPRAVKLIGALLLVAAVAAGGPPPLSTALQRSSPVTAPEVPWRPEPSIGLMWRTEVAATGYVLAGDLVIAAYWGGVAGIEANTGKIRWQYQPPDDYSIVSWGVAAGFVVLSMDTQKVVDPEPEYWAQTAGLEAATGLRLWDHPRVELLPIPAYFEVGGAPDLLASGAGMIVVPWYDFSGEKELGLAGVDPRTGALAWTQRFDSLVIGGFSGCEIIGGGDFELTTRLLVAANDRIAAVVARCAQGQVVIGFEPRTGGPRWAVPLRGGEPQRLIMNGNAILVGLSGQSTIVDSGGRLVFEGDLPSELIMAVAGDIAVISGQDGANSRLVAVDLRSGQTRWSRLRPGAGERAQYRPNSYGSLIAVNKAILGSRGPAGSSPETEDLEPEPTLFAGVADIIDPATGTAQSMVMPMLGGSGVMVVGDLLLMEDERGLTAIRLTPAGTPPVGNAPASPDRWPDACALVSAEDVQGLSPAGRLTPVRQFATLLGQPLPQPTRCPYTNRNGELIFTVAIRWVASDPRTAEAIASAARSLTAGAKWQFYSPLPLIPAVGTWAFGESAKHVTLRVGPVIAEVLSWDVIVPAAEIARLVTERLHALGYQ